MRLPDEKIKQGILHPEEEIRLTAGSYFSRTGSQDRTVMPLVIQAVEKYGRESAFRLLREAEDLLQTEATVEWLITELRRDYDLADLAQDNYRYALGVILAKAPQPILWKRLPDVLSAPAFPQQLFEPLQERLDMFSWDWDRAWSALENLGRDSIRRNELTANDSRYADRLIESLARHREKGRRVLRMLDGDYGGVDEKLVEWLEPIVIDLAGMMHLDKAIRSIVERLHEGDLNLVEDCFRALSHLASDAVVEAIDDAWWEADEEFRSSGASVLDHIHTDFCVEKGLDFLEEEDDAEIRRSLGHALLSHFPEEAIEPVRQLVLGDDVSADVEQLDLRHHLVATCTVMGSSFPEYRKWYADALACKWGSHDRPYRLADAFAPDLPGPKISGNGKKHRWME